MYIDNHNPLCWARHFSNPSITSTKTWLAFCSIEIKFSKVNRTVFYVSRNFINQQYLVFYNLRIRFSKLHKMIFYKTLQYVWYNFKLRFTLIVKKKDSNLLYYASTSKLMISSNDQNFWFELLSLFAHTD